MLNITDYVYRNFDVVKSYGNPQSDWSVNCTKCDDTKQHLNISINKHVVHCWKCGYSASWLGFVMDNSGLSYHKAMSELYNIPRMKDFDAVMNVADTKLRVDEANLPSDYTRLINVGDDYMLYMRYLLNRGFDEHLWLWYRLGVAPSIPWRIIIPIERGYWQGRAIFKWVKPKYLNPKSEARDILFNGSALALYEEVIICEGAFSAMAVGKNAIALIGKEAPPEKLQRLVSSDVEHFIITVEPGAWKTVQSLAEALYKSQHRVTLWKFSIGDPADPINEFEEMEYNLKTRLILNMSV